MDVLTRALRELSRATWRNIKSEQDGREKTVRQKRKQERKKQSEYIICRSQGSQGFKFEVGQHGGIRRASKMVGRRPCDRKGRKRERNRASVLL